MSAPARVPLVRSWSAPASLPTGRQRQPLLSGARLENLSSQAFSSSDANSGEVEAKRRGFRDALGHRFTATTASNSARSTASILSPEEQNERDSRVRAWLANVGQGV
ncbi:MAG: hypothetical protein Q9200_000792 [Gallowayella weberi]